MAIRKKTGLEEALEEVANEEVITIHTPKNRQVKREIYSLIEEGLNQAEYGKVKPMKETLKSIRTKIEQ